MVRVRGLGWCLVQVFPRAVSVVIDSSFGLGLGLELLQRTEFGGQGYSFKGWT